MDKKTIEELISRLFGVCTPSDIDSVNEYRLNSLQEYKMAAAVLLKKICEAASSEAIDNLDAKEIVAESKMFLLDTVDYITNLEDYENFHKEI